MLHVLGDDHHWSGCHHAAFKPQNVFVKESWHQGPVVYKVNFLLRREAGFESFDQTVNWRVAIERAKGSAVDVDRSGH